MWPFDYIKTIRIHDLERTIEILTGANQILTQQLENAQFNEKYLQNKIFDITGVNSQSIPSSSQNRKEPISVGKNIRSWSKTKQDLELKAREEYWNKKKTEELEEQ